MANKQTAVEWFAKELYEKFEMRGDGILYDEILKQAKAMEKEQIIDAFESAEKDCGRDFLHGDLYYNETFKSE